MRFCTRPLFQNKLIIVSITPVSAVIAAATDKHIQKIIGVHVIANPTGAGNLIVSATHCIQIDFPLLIEKGDINIEVLFPHLLNSHRNFSMPLAGVIENFGGWEALTIGVTGFRHQPFGSLGIKFKVALRVISHGAWWGNAVCRNLPTFGNLRNQ